MDDYGTVIESLLKERAICFTVFLMVMKDKNGLVLSLGSSYVVTE